MEKEFNTFFTSDLHFGNNTIAEMRRFINAEEMNNKLISNWNADIQAKDLVISIGSFAIDAITYQSIRPYLNGTILHLIPFNILSETYLSELEDADKYVFYSTQMDSYPDFVFTYLPIMDLKGFANNINFDPYQIVGFSKKVKTDFDKKIINVMADLWKLAPVNVDDLTYFINN